MHRLLLILFTLGLLAYSCADKRVLAQSKKFGERVRAYNMAIIRHAPYFHRENTITSENYRTRILSQHVFYNVPYMIDEENSRNLELHIKDSAAFASKKKIRIPEDSNIVDVKYAFSSVWTWGSHGHVDSISGWIRLIAWNKKGIKIHEDIFSGSYRAGFVIYRQNEFFRYKPVDLAHVQRL